MNTLELVVTERNRLVRYSIVTSIVALVLAIWARDPRLNITTPFSGDEAENITVGHAVLIGHPVVCVLYFVLVAQIFRYKNLAVLLPPMERRHLDWRYLPEEGNGTWTIRVTRSVCEIFRWFGMVGIPAVGSCFLLASQFDFSNQDTREQLRLGNMFNSEQFFGKKPAYMSLQPPDPCCGHLPEQESEACEAENQATKAILSRMPRLYQPYNFIGGLALEILVMLGLWSTTMVFFRSD